ncbi:peptide MFS transporter [Salinimicrobium soli]|uniref:peptide MFS transporter n=1 Tax=Salinimicrobium soli TaxID=1254399 RepID=UPI003AABA84E
MADTVTTTNNPDFFKSKVLGHPAGLFVLFFTEMWERFSYYGMRALLVLFLISSLGFGGWDWPRENALALYGTYTALVYLTPILGGYIADKYIGYRWAVVIGAFIMTLGHASMALESIHAFLYIGIGCLIVGNGFFKPNITSIISHMYRDVPEKKDGAYTIFYMGVNAGAFLGIMLCGYLGEKVGWHYGFGLAGVFMFLGMLQFYFAQGIFGEVGKKPVVNEEGEKESEKLEFEGDKLNPFTVFDITLIVLSALIGIIWIINDPVAKISGVNILNIDGNDYSNSFIIVGLVLFFVLLVSRIFRYSKVVRDRMFAIIMFAVFTVIFWMSFEQAGGSMTIFANDYTNRIMTGDYATIFLIVNIIITIVPVAIITWVLVQLFRKTFEKYALSNIILGFSFVIIWAIIFWMINRDLNSSSYIIEYQTVETPVMDEETQQQVKNEETGEPVFAYAAVTESTDVKPIDRLVDQSTKVIEPVDLEEGDEVFLYDVDKQGSFVYLDEESAAEIRKADKEKGISSTIVRGKVKKINENELEIPATWFLILNSLFIIVFAPLFSKWWESKYNPSAAAKYGLGLILLGVGFGSLALGSTGIEAGAQVASVSLIWLVFAYLFHTLGELCLSPVALSYISKLVPGRMIAMMFGIWYVAIAIGNKLAGVLGGNIDKITAQYDMTTFFLIFTIVPMALGLLAIMLHPLIKKLMHGVR